MLFLLGSALKWTLFFRWSLDWCLFWDAGFESSGASVVLLHGFVFLQTEHGRFINTELQRKTQTAKERGQNKSKPDSLTVTRIESAYTQ